MLPRKPHRTLTPSLDPSLKPIFSQRRHNLLLQPLDGANHNPKKPHPHKPTNMRQHLAHDKPPQRISVRGIAEQQHERIQKAVHFRRRRAVRRVARAHTHGSALQAAVGVVGVGAGPQEVGAQHGGDAAQVLRCGVGAQARDVVFGRGEVRVRVQVERGRVREGVQVRGGEGVG
jgi:hypothetical protein